jgi:hypothetical protein
LSDCVANLFAALRESNNRIRQKDILNQCCALAFVLESISLFLAAKQFCNTIGTKRTSRSPVIISAKDQKRTETGELFSQYRVVLSLIIMRRTDFPIESSIAG